MCMKKPGPRCSNDTKKAMEAADAAWAEYKETHPNWNQETDDYSRSLIFATNVTHDQYRASPEGIQALEDEMSEAYDTGRNHAGAKQRYVDGEVYSVQSGVKEGPILAAKLKAIKEHREWQGKTLKSLEAVEKESSVRGSLEYARMILGRLEAQKAAVLADPERSFRLADVSREEQELGVIAAQRAKADGVSSRTELQLPKNWAKVATDLRSKVQYEITSEAYLDRKIEDMKDYVKSAEKKINHMVDEPAAATQYFKEWLDTSS